MSSAAGSARRLCKQARSGAERRYRRAQRPATCVENEKHIGASTMIGGDVGKVGGEFGRGGEWMGGGRGEMGGRGEK